MFDFDAADMPVGDVVGDALVTVSPDTDLRGLAGVMDERGVGAIGVIDGDTLIGVISERDVVRAVAQGRETTTSAGDLAHRELVWADPTAPVLEVAEEMMEQWIRHVLVGDPANVVGMVSARDLLAVFAANAEAGAGDLQLDEDVD